MSFEVAVAIGVGILAAWWTTELFERTAILRLRCESLECRVADLEDALRDDSPEGGEPGSGGETESAAAAPREVEP